MEEKKCCTVINNQYYGCCCCRGDSDTGTSTPAPFGALKYMQLKADLQSSITKDKKIYFNDKSFGDFELTDRGAVVLNPGTYLVFLNCQIITNDKPAYASILFHDLISGKDITDYVCTRITPTRAVNTSNCEGLGIIRFTEKVELCINGSYVEGNPALEDVYASIIRIAELPATKKLK
ncbi:hypothetical protein ABFV83_02240 [Lacrimispora sp. BS-2]|uniref:Uncharacterized protein n=1 Tax=Lacrimispora sp. BS-2 TaxID=3151850 RepID=A0AAU7PQH1_9FIRM